MNGFEIIYYEWDPAKQKLREALCTLGNGYFATRGAAEESIDDGINYPGTYLAGGYNRAKTEISGRVIENEDFVNFPNWLYLSLKTEGNDWLDFESYKLIDYKQTLRMKEGILERNFRIEDNQDRRIHIISRRFVSMNDMHLAGIQWIFVPENFSGRIKIRTALDGTVINNGVERYRELEGRHLSPLSARQVNENTMLMLVETRQSKIVMAQTAKTTVYKGDKIIEDNRKTKSSAGYIEQVLDFEVKEGEQYKVEKIASIYTSRDKAITEASLEACHKIKEAAGFEELLDRSIRSYEKLWYRFDIEIADGERMQQLIRLHIFHVLQTVSFHSVELDAGVPSRGLHGEAYRGHIFWDEIFIFPYLNFRFPETTRSFLKYRFNRLYEARKAAVKEGYRGAMFPWQSGSNGREESQVLHLNPKSGRWLPDDTHIQRHLSSAIAYNIWNYFRVADDRQFLSFYGAEMFLNIALFWSSKSQFNKERRRYEILHVVGPDEYHTSYPNSDEKGLNNNAYTNIMAAWVLQKALEITDLIEHSRKMELFAELNIDEKELARWKDISKKMFVPFISEGIIDQFEGYESLEEFPWKKYTEKYGNIQRLDRILESEGDSPNHYKASKQADALMLFYLFPEEELISIFNRLGYDFSTGAIIKNINYYRERTSHGSTLSRFVYSWILARYDKDISWKNFETLLISDFEDIQGGTTPEGIHLGAMAGSLDLVQRCYSGIEVREDVLWINPGLPDNIKCIKFRIIYRRHWISLTIKHNVLKISFEEGWSNKVMIGVIDQVYLFSKGEEREFPLVKSGNSVKAEG
jgi:trehalose/maltose hydrolase-like predicted phosphorylase